MSLAEILMAMAILSSFTLAVLMVIFKAMDLNRHDAVVSETTMLCNEVMDQDTRMAASAYEFEYLPSLPYTRFTYQSDYIYAQSVSDYAPNLKRLTVAVYYQDPHQSAPAPDPSRARGGQIIRMSALLVKPTAPLPSH